MNILTSIASLFSCFTKAATPNPMLLPPPGNSPPPPEPSCFVKGLIHSMKTEPEMWERKYLYGNYWVCRDVILYENDQNPYHCPASPLPAHESKLLAAAVKKYLVEPMNQREEQIEKREEAKKRAHFEMMGCPEKSP